MQEYVSLRNSQVSTAALQFYQNFITIETKLIRVFHQNHFHQNFLSRSSPTKRIRVQLKDCAQMTISHWSFSSQSQLGFFM